MLLLSMIAGGEVPVQELIELALRREPNSVAELYESVPHE
jgi:hypothetical protein